MAVPAGFSTSPAGLPVGIQIAAKPFEEEIIYRVAHAYEAETDWHQRRPQL
jgi:aspartyl-tRNA(Asn)/glutamyl-tRNA(Gln) amidotransferase subunit A